MIFYFQYWHLLSLTCVLLLGFHIPVYAQDSPPIPQRKTNMLETLEREIKTRQSTSQSIAKKVATAKANLERTKKDIAAITDDVMSAEKDLYTLEDEISILSAKEQKLNTDLGEDYEIIADLILAMERMRKIPPEAIIARPVTTLQTAQTSMLLQSTLPAVYHRSERLAAMLQELHAVERKLKRNKESARTLYKSLRSKQSNMNALIRKREALLDDLHQDKTLNDAMIARMSAQATSLKGLLEKIEKAKIEKQREAERNKRNVSFRPIPMIEDMPKIGNIRSPAAGSVFVKYGETDLIGAKSQGIHIASISEGLVVAPMGGIVQFANDFKNHGKLIIIKHDKGYHSLISGLGVIETKIGRRVNSGEPIARLPISASPGGHPALYYELRYKGKPINPYKKLPR